jgi:hypothetical protein
MSLIPMLLWCPSCGERHIDAGEFATREHHTHACQSCGVVWRPAIVPTVGVQFLPGFKDGMIEAPSREAPDGAYCTENAAVRVWSRSHGREVDVPICRGDTALNVGKNVLAAMETWSR